MARTASPWFWEERQGWYVNKNGQRQFLGQHPEGAPAPRKHKGKWNAPQQILLAFHSLMAAPAEQPPQQAPLAAYVAGTMGTLIGGDLLHVRKVRRLAAPVASIGGAGTFDGVFLTGIIAVLLA